MDEELRHYERLAAQGSDEAAAQVLIIRMRKGDLPRENVEITAMLGHQPSTLAVGEQEIPKLRPMLRFIRTLRSLPENVEILHSPETGTGIASQAPGISKYVFDLIWTLWDIDYMLGLHLIVCAAKMVENLPSLVNSRMSIGFGERLLNGETIDSATAVTAGIALADVVVNIHSTPYGDAARSAAMVSLVAARINESRGWRTWVDSRFYACYAINYAASALAIDDINLEQGAGAWPFKNLMEVLDIMKQRVIDHCSRELIEYLLIPGMRINPDEEEIAKYKKLLETETDFIERERYHLRLLEAQDITPSTSMATLGSTIEACDEILKAHGYNFTRELGLGSHGYVYTSGPGEVTKVTRSPMEAAIAQLFVSDPVTCFPEIASVEDITFLCESHIPIFAIRRENLHDFKGSKELYRAIRRAFSAIRRNVGQSKILERVDPDNILTEEEVFELEQLMRCVYAVKRKYRFIFNDIDFSALSTRVDGSIVIRDFSYCAYISD